MTETLVQTKGAWSIDEALKLSEQGWSYQRIGDHFGGISRQAVGARLSRHTGGATKGGNIPKKRIMPWRVAAADRHGYMGRNLAFALQLASGEDIAYEDKVAVRGFLDGLTDLFENPAVTYDPEEGRGFTFRARKASDPQPVTVELHGKVYKFTLVA